MFLWPTQLRESTAESRAAFLERARRVPQEVTKDGALPYNVYTIREKGKLEVGNQSCALCHTRLMPDGTTIVGAQGHGHDLPKRRKISLSPDMLLELDGDAEFVLPRSTPAQPAIPFDRNFGRSLSDRPAPSVHATVTALLACPRSTAWRGRSPPTQAPRRSRRRIRRSRRACSRGTGRHRSAQQDR